MPLPLEVSNLSKSYQGVPVLRRVNLAVRSGEILALLGPSGCGKTTTLRLVAGFEWPDEGTITINGRVVADATTRVPAEERRVGMVFQEYALFPHLDVAGNVAFGLQGSASEKRARVDELLALVGLSGLGGRMPYELSGGQQQRIALARALAPRPDILLLDEPFSNLDAALRGQVRAEVRAILKRSGVTCIFVTHDQEEALSLADEIAVMFEGRIAQVGAPEHVYHHPDTPEVAAFVGEANFLPAQAEGSHARTPFGLLALVRPAYGPVTLLLRPEALRIDPTGDTATVEWREFYGHDQRLGVRLNNGTRWIIRAESRDGVAVGQRVGITVQQPVHAFPA